MYRTTTRFVLTVIAPVLAAANLAAQEAPADSNLERNPAEDAAVRRVVDNIMQP